MGPGSTLGGSMTIGNHQARVEFVHARHVVAVSTRRMRGNKIDFSPVEDEKEDGLKDKEIRL